MASGVPVVTTPAGTLSIATNEDTALVTERPTPQALARGLLRIRNDHAFASAMAARARAHIEHYDWERYTDRLIGLVQDYSAGAHGARAPELGLSA
jgi:glycosyltransferase involved in cell wall biosynthesis